MLTVDLYCIYSDCGTTDFEVKDSISSGDGETPCTVTISVVPVIPIREERTWACSFNLSYTVQGLEENNFYLVCWWYEGQVELTEGEPLVLDYKTEDVVIDGLKFSLLKIAHQAMLLNQGMWDCDSPILQIPSEVEYEGEKYTVTSIADNVGVNTTIKKITIPKTIKKIYFYGLEGITRNPFQSCRALETLEVEKGNPVICSIDGVLFNKDMTTLIGYPTSSPRESYTVPDGVVTVARSAFACSLNLKKVVLPDCVKILDNCAFCRSENLEVVVFSQNIEKISYSLFSECTKLKSVVIPKNVSIIEFEAFYGCSSLESITLPESVIWVDKYAFMNCTSLKSATLCQNLKEIPEGMFGGCSELTEVIIPVGITVIGRGAFNGCKAMQSFDLPESIQDIGDFAFRYLSNLKDIYCHATTVPNTNNAFYETDLSQVTLHVPTASIADYETTSPWNQFGAIVPLESEMAYRPFVENGKVWKVGGVGSNPVQWVEYYYFEGDTIIDGKSCKQMMRQQYNPDIANISQYPLPGEYVGAWYEEDKQVYEYDSISHQFMLMYDFSVGANDTLLIDNLPYVIGPRQTGDMDGFKGVYRDVMLCVDSIYSTPWLEGVGSIDRPTTNVYPGCVDPVWFLMSCTVGDEVIYLNDEYEDGATPDVMGVKNRFDFTHTIKTKPKAPMMREKSDACISSSEREVSRPKVKAPMMREKSDACISSSEREVSRPMVKAPMKRGTESPLYGEYNDLLLDINLAPLDDAYLVRITDESGKAVYEKDINAGIIIGLNIDISAYAEGRYTVTVENSQEVFTGEFGTQTTGIEDIALTPALPQEEEAIYNLQGQRISYLRKGLNIVNGQKVYVK